MNMLELLEAKYNELGTDYIYSYRDVMSFFDKALIENGSEWVQINYTPSIITISTIGVNRVFRKIREGGRN